MPDCDLGNFAKNGECGALNNQFFGKNNPNAISLGDEVRKGWGVRDNNWDYSRRGPARAAQRPVGDRRLLPQHRRLLPQHRTASTG